MRTMTVQSANVRRLCLGLESRRMVAVLPAGGGAKNQSPPRLLTMVSPEPRRDASDDSRRKRARKPTGHSLASASSSFSNDAAVAPAPRRLGGVEAGLERARTYSWAPFVSRSRHDAATGPARAVSKKPPAPPRDSSESIKRGDQVLVRTPVGNLPTGQLLVLWLSAVAVSANEDGYLRVVYNGKFPLDDPYRTVRVAAEDVKKMPPADGSSDGSTGSSTVTTAASHKP